MLPAEERAVPAQPAPVQPLLRHHLQEPSLAFPAGEAAVPQSLALPVPAVSEKAQSMSQKSSQPPTGQGTSEHTGQKEIRDVDMKGASGNRKAPAEAGEGHNNEVSYHDAQCHITLEGQLEATAAAMEADLAPDDDLPLTSLFGAAEAAPLEQHSSKSADRSEASQRPSADSASSQPASQDSNQENQLPPAEDAVHRCVSPAVNLRCSALVTPGCRQHNAASHRPQDPLVK